MSHAPSSDIVPFGKYKGRPVVDLIADRSYTDWLAAQPWFRERYATVYNLIVNTGGEPQDTPEHNKMQARYLSHDECLTLLRVWLHDHARHHASWTEVHEAALTARQRGNLSVAGGLTAAVDSLRFESYGWDLVVKGHSRVAVSQLSGEFPCECACDPTRCAVRTTSQWETTNNPYGRTYLGEVPNDVTGHPRDWSTCYSSYEPRVRVSHCTPDCRATWKSDESRSYTKYEKATRALVDTVTVAVELKPALGDDYPSVLRAVIKRREMCQARGALAADCCAVLADEVHFEGVDLPAVRKIFRSQKVDLLTSAELPSPSAEWRCSCADCASP